jgi:hypothetical protein
MQVFPQCLVIIWLVEGLGEEASGALSKEYTMPKYKAATIFPMRKSQWKGFFVQNWVCYFVLMVVSKKKQNLYY